MRHWRRDRCVGSMAERAQIIVKGVVQGVGFRPYVFNLAGALNLKGQVTNTSGQAKRAGWRRVADDRDRTAAPRD